MKLRTTSQTAFREYSSVYFLGHYILRWHKPHRSTARVDFSKSALIPVFFCLNLVLAFNYKKILQSCFSSSDSGKFLFSSWFPNQPWLSLCIRIRLSYNTNPKMTLPSVPTQIGWNPGTHFQPRTISFQYCFTYQFKSTELKQERVRPCCKHQKNTIADCPNETGQENGALCARSNYVWIMQFEILTFWNCRYFYNTFQTQNWKLSDSGALNSAFLWLPTSEKNIGLTYRVGQFITLWYFVHVKPLLFAFFARFLTCFFFG